MFEPQVSEERYEAATSSIVAANHNCVIDNEDEDACANPQDCDFDFTRDNNYMLAGITDLTAYFDKKAPTTSCHRQGSQVEGCHGVW